VDETSGRCGVNRRAPTIRPDVRTSTIDDEKLSDDINSLLRQAAEEREARAQAKLATDIAAARHDFAAVIDMARSRTGKSARR